MSWFDTITESADIDGLVGYINSCVNVLKSTATEDEDSNSIAFTFEILAYEMIGYLPNKTRVSQESWYNIWASSNSFNTQVLFLIQEVENKQTGSLKNFYDNLNEIVKFVITRYFSNPIPDVYWTGNGPPEKPIITVAPNLRHSPVLDSLYTFFYNGSTGIKGLGNNVFTDMCGSYTREMITKYPYIRKWCGCFSPDDPIAIQAKERYPEQASYTKSCDPICVHISSIKLVDPDKFYEVEPCNSQLCILSKVSLATSDFDGSINLNQTCPCSKENGPCFCIIDSTIEDLLNKTTAPNGSSMAVPITFKQYCPGARCMVLDEETQELTEVECENDNPNYTSIINAERKKDGGKKPNISLFFILGIFVVFIVLFVLCARHIVFEPKIKVNNIVKQSNNISKYTRTTDLGYITTK